MDLVYTLPNGAFASGNGTSGVVVTEQHLTQPGTYLIRAVVKVAGFNNFFHQAHCVLIVFPEGEQGNIFNQVRDDAHVLIPSAFNGFDFPSQTVVLEVVATTTTASQSQPADIHVQCTPEPLNQFSDMGYTSSISSLRVNATVHQF